MLENKWRKVDSVKKSKNGRFLLIETFVYNRGDKKIENLVTIKITFESPETNGIFGKRVEVLSSNQWFCLGTDDEISCEFRENTNLVNENAELWIDSCKKYVENISLV